MFICTFICPYGNCILDVNELTVDIMKSCVNAENPYGRVIIIATNATIWYCVIMYAIYCLM